MSFYTGLGTKFYKTNKFLGYLKIFLPFGKKCAIMHLISNDTFPMVTRERSYI